MQRGIVLSAALAACAAAAAAPTSPETPPATPQATRLVTPSAAWPAPPVAARPANSSSAPASQTVGSPVSPVSPESPVSPNTRDPVQDFAALVSAGRLEEAEQLLPALPRAAVPAGLLAAAAQQAAGLEDWPAVERWLRQRQTQLGPAECRLLAEALRRNGQPAEALDWLRLSSQRYREDLPLAAALAEELLAAGQPASALAHLTQAARTLGSAPALWYAEARARFALGQALGDARVRPVPGGRAGQFDGAWLLIERRTGSPAGAAAPATQHMQPDAQPGQDEFLCAPRDSALYAVRRALDAGHPDPAAHVLHARIWLQIARADVALGILRSQEAAWLPTAPDEVLAAAAEIAWQAASIPDFLRYTRQRARRRPHEAASLQAAASAAVAEWFNQRGDERLWAAFLARSLEHKPADPGLWRKLGDAEWSAGRLDAAQDCYRRVLELEPAHADRGDLLSRLRSAGNARSDEPR